MEGYLFRSQVSIAILGDSNKPRLLNRVQSLSISGHYLPRNCGHIREVTLGERDSKYIDSIVVVKIMAILERPAIVESGHKEKDGCITKIPD